MTTTPTILALCTPKIGENLDPAHRHSHGHGNPACGRCRRSIYWFPAFARMTYSRFEVAAVLSLLLLMGICSPSLADAAAAPLKVLRYGSVNDTVVDAVTPGGLVKTTSGDFITTFVDKGDSAAGSKCYFVRSKDEGKTWSAPYLVVEPEDPKEGIFTELVQLTNGDLLMLLIRIAHVDTSRESVFNYRESTIELKRSKDNGESFTSIGFLVDYCFHADRYEWYCTEVMWPVQMCVRAYLWIRVRLT